MSRKIYRITINISRYTKNREAFFRTVSLFWSGNSRFFRRLSSLPFLTKYSTPDHTVVISMSTTTSQSRSNFPMSGVSCHGVIIRQRPTSDTVVLILPLHAAAITTPFSTAISRRPVTANSRAMMTMAAQLGICPQATKISTAANTSSLSASGSMNLPKSDT